MLDCRVSFARTKADKSFEEIVALVHKNVFFRIILGKKIIWRLALEISTLATKNILFLSILKRALSFLANLGTTTKYTNSNNYFHLPFPPSISP